MDCRAGKASAPNRLLKARSKGLGDCLAASAGVAGATTDSVMGCKALAPLASLSGFTRVPIGSGGLGVSTAALGTAAPVLLQGAAWFVGESWAWLTRPAAR